MGKKPIEPYKRAQAVALHQVGFNLTDISRELKISRCCERNTINKFEQHGTFEDLKQSGRPKALSTRDIRDLKRLVTSENRLSVGKIRMDLNISRPKPVSRETVRRYLKNLGYEYAVKIKKPWLTVKHKKDRVKWCKQYQHWTIHDWRKVIFSDESTFYVLKRKNQVKIWRSDDERLLPECVQQMNTGNGGKIGIWGGLDCLTTLIIDVKEICRELSNEVNVKELPKLKCFSLTSVECTFKYDDQIIPLLRRMTNLEELMLFLIVLRKHSTFIDGILLHAQILIYMQRLNKFSFSIISDVLNMNIRIILPTNEDIRRSFMEKEYNQVDSYVHTRAMDSVGRCHIYSLPYQFENFLYLNNSFQGGKFDKVRCLEMNDSRPFEYDFFKRISEDFPFLKELRIWNIQPQKEKQHLTTLIVFPHLMLLNLVKAHVDYAEQLLFHKNTYLPCLLDLCINYKSLATVTNNFTNDAACFTCAKLKRLRIDYAFVRPSNFNQYFPLL
ncbi:unnamed protein product [Rotaria sp. Silwood2]|nr:unnamed protein product [Rotaria sp. Silwood2]